MHSEEEEMEALVVEGGQAIQIHLVHLLVPLMEVVQICALLVEQTEALVAFACVDNKNNNLLCPDLGCHNSINSSNFLGLPLRMKDLEHLLSNSSQHCHLQSP